MRAPVVHRLPPVFLLALLLAACAVGPDFRRPLTEAPAQWSPTAGTAAAPADAVQTWWAGFGDPELDSLARRAAAANLDARQALLRVAEARAQRDVAVAAQWPSLGVNAGGQVDRLSQTTPTGALFSRVGHVPALGNVGIPNPYDQYQLGFDASWEVDLFGRVRRSVEAGGADSEAMAWDSRAVLVTVLGDVGRAYIDLRGAQARRRLMAQSIATEGELLDLAERRRASGLGSGIELDRAAAEAAGARAEFPAIDRRITEDVNQLSRLLALPPGALRGELDAERPIPAPPQQVSIGLPADLARRRPDIGEAEARLHAATARVGVAVGDLYPRLTLSAQGGYQSESLATLTQWASRFLIAGPSVQLPIFDGGRRRATVRLQGAREGEAALDYRRTVLAALNEVENALAAYAADQARRTALAEAVARNTEAVDLARQRFTGGVAGDVEVLQAERTLQQNALALTEATTAASGDLVVLYKALGGGWS